MTQAPPRPNLCPHKANPAACPICYQLNLKAKSKQPPPQRTSLEPQITQGRVTPQLDNPVLVAQIEKKNKALGVTPEMLQAQRAAVQGQQGPTMMRQDVPAGTQAQPPRVSSPIQQHAQNPHLGGSVPADVQQSSDGSTGVYIDTAELERMFPKHQSIIDRQPSHPDGHNSSKGNINPGRSSSRAPVTKGRTPGQ